MSTDDRDRSADRAGSGDAAVEFELDGCAVSAPAGGSLLDALREHLGVRSPKDGCSPQGQCGCCTVWVDDRPRVACVTPVTRVAGRRVTTVDGLADADRWADAFARCGATQCGFCTPGIIMRLAALGPDELTSRTALDTALKAHLCRCTGWTSIVEAAALIGHGAGEVDTAAVPVVASLPSLPAVTDRARSRARVEGGVPQEIGPEVALGRGGFADDTAPADALVAVRAGTGTADWVVAESLAAARLASGKVQGRRTTAPVAWPIEIPVGGWERTLRTTWVEPAYLEPDAAWAEPGGPVHGPLGNGGAFGGKLDSEVAEVARRLADEHGRPVRVLATREDVVRHGPKRPPIAIGMSADGTGVAHVARTSGIAEVIAAVAPGLQVIEVDVVGPPTSAALRAAGWLEATVMLASLGSTDTVTSPAGAVATAHIDEVGDVHVSVTCGADPHDPSELTVLRSYCLGAAHMALGLVRTEAVSVGDDGAPLDLTIRSFGVLRAADTPTVHVDIDTSGPPTPVTEMVSGSDAVLAAVAAAAWRRAGFPPAWPVERSR